MSDLYQPPTLTDDGPTSIAAGMMLDYADLTGIVLPEASIEAALFEVIAETNWRTRLAVNDSAATVMAAVAGFHGITRNPATKAIAEITIHGTQGAVIPQNTVLVTNDKATWETLEPLTITHTGQAQGRIQAVLEGPSTPGIIGLINQLGPITGVDRITLDRVTQDGTDEEPIWDFLDRAKDELSFQSIIPRLPHEFAAYARRSPHVDAAKAVNRWDLTTNRQADGHITVYVAKDNGQTIDSSTIRQIAEDMNKPNARPLNVKVHVTQPTRVPITVQIKIKPHSHETAEAIRQRVELYASPAQWNWDDNQITALDIARAIGTTETAEVLSISLNGSQSVPLTSTTVPFALPNVTVNVTA